LIFPVHYQSGQRYPLIVMNYFFDGAFIADASRAHTSWPVQAFARDGYAVLLINKPVFQKLVDNDFEHGSKAFGLSPLSSLEAIIQQFSSEGLIDPQRVGFEGHSWGGFWVEFALTHSHLLRVAQIINGGTSTEPGTYWITGAQRNSAWQEQVMGGPPWGASLKNYLQFSATLNADKVTAPLLIQADGFEAPFELEMYSALRRNEKPVEFMIYPNDGHTFTSPEHRFHSMEMNLDWFEFWLSGREDPSPDKVEQYVRWREMQRDCVAHAGCAAAGS